MKDAAIFDPGTQAAIPANQEAIQEQSESAQESASQDVAMGVDSEEGTTEG